MKANLSWSMDVECPKCDNYFDLVDNDDDGVVATAIFSNNWDALKEFEVTCPECGHEFEIDGVEY
jgi:ribosomal protein S27E